MAPQPSPSPKGEGTDRGVYARYADPKDQAELEFEKPTNRLPLLGERAGVRGEFSAVLGRVQD